MEESNKKEWKEIQDQTKEQDRNQANLIGGNVSAADITMDLKKDYSDVIFDRVNYRIEIEVECNNMQIAQYYAECALEGLDDKHVQYNYRIIIIEKTKKDVK